MREFDFKTSCRCGHICTLCVTLAHPTHEWVFAIVRVALVLVALVRVALVRVALVRVALVRVRNVCIFPFPVRREHAGELEYSVIGILDPRTEIVAIDRHLVFYS